jgi:hypothetical protein
MSQNAVYIILDDQKTTDGEYIPCIVVEGRKGYNLTDWKWGKDKAIAERLADERNSVLGFNKEAVQDMKYKSMFIWKG